VRTVLLLVVLLVVGCRRREEAPSAPVEEPVVVDAARPRPPPSSAPSATHAEDPPMTPEKKRVLAALRAHAGDKGEVRGTFAELRRWIGPDAHDWPLPDMLMQLDPEGEIAVHVLSKDAGADPAFVLDAWRR
jgi:hypothetical protein